MSAADSIFITATDAQGILLDRIETTRGALAAATESPIGAVALLRSIQIGADPTPDKPVPVGRPGSDAQLAARIAAHEAAGGGFFRSDLLSVWDSRCETGLLHDGYFITSEVLAAAGRRYTVRFIHRDGDIDPVLSAEFGTHETLTDALTDVEARAHATHRAGL